MALFIATFRNAKGRYLVTEDAGGYEGQRIRDARQLRYGNKPDARTGLFLDENWRMFGPDEMLTKKPAPSVQETHGAPMTTKSTPGPWKADGDMIHASEKVIALEYPRSWWRLKDGRPTGERVSTKSATREERTANARLIAAAPALRDALRRIRDERRHDPACASSRMMTKTLEGARVAYPCDCHHEIARAALALAGE